MRTSDILKHYRHQHAQYIHVQYNVCLSTKHAYTWTCTLAGAPLATGRRVASWPHAPLTSRPRGHRTHATRRKRDIRRSANATMRASLDDSYCEPTHGLKGIKLIMQGIPATRRPSSSASVSVSFTPRSITYSKVILRRAFCAACCRHAVRVGGVLNGHGKNNVQEALRNTHIH